MQSYQVVYTKRYNSPPVAIFIRPDGRSRRAGISCSPQTRTSISPIFNHFRIRRAEIGRTPCYTGVWEGSYATLPVPTTRRAAPHLVRPDATWRRCSARLRHKTLRDRRKPQKEDGLLLYENFVRISRLASPTATRCNLLRTATVPRSLRP